MPSTALSLEFYGKENRPSQGPGKRETHNQIHDCKLF